MSSYSPSPLPFVPFSTSSSPSSPPPSLPSLINSAERQQVHLPPHRHSDFIIHYHSTDYHVHKLVLHHHSAYFRAYFDALTPLADIRLPSEDEEKDSSSPDQKKLKTSTADDQHTRRLTLTSSSSSSFSCSPTPPCDHPVVVQCIHLPHQCGIEQADEDDFLLFLRHLYFSSTPRYPPFAPDSTIEDELSDDTPVNYIFPTSQPTEHNIRRYAKVGSTDEMRTWLPSLLSLFHYFDCSAALQRCDEVITAWNEGGIVDAWEWLLQASRYGLKGAERRCIKHVARDEEVEGDEEVREVWDQLSADVQFRVLGAISTRMSKKGNGESWPY